MFCFKVCFVRIYLPLDLGVKKRLFSFGGGEKDKEPIVWLHILDDK